MNGRIHVKKTADPREKPLTIHNLDDLPK